MLLCHVFMGKSFQSELILTFGMGSQRADFHSLISLPQASYQEPSGRIYPTFAASIEIEPPSTPSTGKVIDSRSCRVATT